MSTRPSITTLAIVGLISLAALAAGTLVDLADVAAVLQRITAALGPWTYAVVAVLVFLETVALAGLVSPGEATLAVGDAAAAQGEIALVPLLAVVWTAGGNVALALAGAVAITYLLRRRAAPSTRTRFA
jgi:membrane protein DedA with SNARE-associated domain